MGACPECGEGPVVRGICRACHTHIADEDDADAAPRRPVKRGGSSAKLEDRRAEWYGAAGVAVPESKTRDDLSREAGDDPDEPGLYSEGAVAAAEARGSGGRKLLIFGAVALLLGVVGLWGGSKFLAKLGEAGSRPAGVDSLKVEDGRFEAPELGFTVKVPGDLLAVEPEKLPVEARTLVIVPKGGKGVIVLASDGTFTGLVAGSPGNAAAAGLELLPPGIADTFNPTLNTDIIPVSFKQFEAWSFDLSDGGDEGTVHLARMPDGRVFVVLGWGPAVMSSRTKGRIAALLQGLAIGEKPAQ